MPGPAADDRDRPAAEALQAEQPEDRDEVADVERRRRTGRTRCSRRSAVRSRAGPAGPGVVACRMPRHSSSASSPPGLSPVARAVTGRSVEASGPTGRRPNVRSRSLCYRAATDADHSRAAPAPSTGARASTAGTARIAPSVAIVIAVPIVLRPRRRPRWRAAGASSPWAPTTTTRRACPTPRKALTEPRVRAADVIYDRTGKVELARLGDLKRELVTFDQLPGEMLDATTAIEDKDFWINPGLRPGRHRVRRPRHARRPAPRRLDDHPAARPRAAPARRRRSRARPTSARSARSSSRSA